MHGHVWSKDLSHERFLELAKAEHDALWRSADLSFLLHADQLRVYSAIKSSNAERFVLEIARKWGKTWLECVLAIEPCLESPGSRVVYGGPSLKHLEEFIQPVMRELTDNAPADCKPVWHDADGHWRFPNGSWIHLFAADDMAKARRGRGPKAKRALFDEAGFTPVLEYVLDDVFRPSLMLNTEGRRLTILGSTPSDVPDHPFTLIAEIEERAGNYAHRTIHDNPMMTPDAVTKFVTENARQKELPVDVYLQTDSFRREYMAERIVDKLLVAVPEWKAFREESFRLYRETVRPKLFRGHVSIDFGGSDPHAALFAYYHLSRGTVIERDLLIHGNETSRELDEDVKAIERDIWGVTKWDGTLAALTSEYVRGHFEGKVPAWLQERVDALAQPQPWLRVCDTQMKLARHLHNVGLACIPTAKDEKRLYVQELRNSILAKQFVVNPDCEDLDRHLRATTWSDLKHTQWARRGDEHGDLVDCAVYLVRNIDHDVPLDTVNVPPPEMDAGEDMTPLERRLVRGRAYQ